MALARAPLDWFTLHVVAAFHYVNIFYGTAGGATEPLPAPLQFPGGRDPMVWDFLYYAFVVGMTAQVSDVQVVGAKMRRATLGHGVGSFFFNTVLIAMAVNAVVNIAAWSSRRAHPRHAAAASYRGLPVCVAPGY